MTGEEVFAQGASSIGNDMVAVGASSGRILIFKKDSGTFSWADTLQGNCETLPFVGINSE